ncbi:MAG: riboflavin synthase [Pseudomonadota bacterium]
MFTGIVREVGRVLSVSKPFGEDGDTRVEIACARPVEEIEIGASIACSGCCLTVVATGMREGRPWFAVDASGETLGVTTLRHWRAGSRVNLEPSLKVGDELGGHIVSGHVDGLGVIEAVRPEGGSHRVDVAAPKTLARYLAPKGSIALDGISLTVNTVEDRDDGAVFGINVIPHTWAVTTLADAGAGTEVNLEVDLLARYVARLTAA